MRKKMEERKFQTKESKKRNVWEEKKKEKRKSKE